MNTHDHRSIRIVVSILLLITATATRSIAQNLLTNDAFDTDVSSWEPANATITVIHRPDAGTQARPVAGSDLT